MSTAEPEESPPEPTQGTASPAAGERQPGDEPDAQQAELHEPVAAPEKGQGKAYTIDNRLGYRKEDSPDGKRRQIRFANRPGAGRPDDEMLAPVREQKPHVSWAGKEKAWQARKMTDALEAIDSADQKLADLGRKRTEPRHR